MNSFRAGLLDGSMANQFHEFAKSIYQTLPEALKANIDFYLRPSVRDPWGGPFNGQARRLEAVTEIFAFCNFDFVVETGTFRGTTTEFLASIFQRDIYSCEINKAFHLYSKIRLKGVDNVSLERASSVDFLEALAKSGRLADSSVFFYLDAHWQDHLPLREEFEIILEAAPNSVIVIDDFQVPDDPGYQYDDYGPGKALTLEYLSTLLPRRFFIFFPESPSAQETGAKRGCIVVTPSEAIAKTLRSAVSLRDFGVSTNVLANMSKTPC